MDDKDAKPARLIDLEDGAGPRTEEDALAVVEADEAFASRLAGLSERTRGHALPMGEDFQSFLARHPEPDRTIPEDVLAEMIGRARENILRDGDRLHDMGDGRGLRRASEIIEELDDPVAAAVLVERFLRQQRRRH